MTAVTARRQMARSRAAHAKFLAFVLAAGGVVTDVDWKGSNQIHRARCGEGHECRVYPCHLAKGLALCSTCTGRSKGAAARKFRELIEGLGGVDSEDPWRGTDHPRRCVCPAGHECLTYPCHAFRGIGICRVCSGMDPGTAFASHVQRIGAHGGRDEGGSWGGVDSPRRTECPNGHETRPTPSAVMQAGRIPCKHCAGQDPTTVERAFLDRLAGCSATPLYDEWRGATVPHLIRCRVGHITAPRPVSMRSGAGPCRYCRGKMWDAFYVVTDPVSAHTKFGITSGDPLSRLSDHRRDGFTEVVRVFTGLPGTVAPDLERLLLSTLRDAGEVPVRGREYFDISVLATILDIVDNYPLTA